MIASVPHDSKGPPAIFPSHERGTPLHTCKDRRNAPRSSLRATRTFASPVQLLTRKVQGEVTSARSNWDYLFDRVPVPCVVTDGAG